LPRVSGYGDGPQEQKATGYGGLLTMDGLFVEKFRAFLDKLEGECIEHAVSGLAQDEYQQQCGRIDGIRTVRDQINEIIRELRKD
jgi:hypothetical protein